jgi:ribosomal protein S18 acetylase RimI-like enzyme
MYQRISNATRSDVESLIEIYCSPDLYHNRKEASRFVKSYLDYHHAKVVRHGRRIIGAIFWNSVEKKHHGIANVQDLWIEESFRRKGLGEKLLRSAIEDMKELYSNHRYPLRKVLVTTGD